MSKIQCDVDVAKDGVANDVLPVWWMEVYLFVLANQNHSYMPKWNDKWMHAITAKLSIFRVIQPHDHKVLKKINKKMNKKIKIKRYVENKKNM